jgi:catechol 2,3-dioxygenase-like lactoylglutathione lyase family enzyme
MINGAHSIIYSTDADADRAFLRDVLGFGSVDVGGGWLIFGLPPAEVAVHPSERNGVHELYFMCDDVEAFVAEMQAHGIACDPVQNQGWGLLTQLTLPGGGKLGVYQPRHARPAAAPVARKKTARKKTKQTKKTKPASRKRAVRAKKRRR